jgi:hypothetical protein
VFFGIGKAANRTVTVAEILKRRLKVYQKNEIKAYESKDEYIPQEGDQPGGPDT